MDLATLQYSKLERELLFENSEGETAHTTLQLSEPRRTVLVEALLRTAFSAW